MVSEQHFPGKFMMTETRSEAVIRDTTMKEVEDTLNSKIASIEGRLESQFSLIEERLEGKIDNRIAQINETLKTRMGEMVETFNSFTNNGATSSILRGRRPIPDTGQHQPSPIVLRSQNPAPRNVPVSSEEGVRLRPVNPNLHVNNTGYSEMATISQFFAKEVIDNPIAELEGLQENEIEGIMEYHRKFELIRNRVHLPEEYLVDVYLAGLISDTQIHVRMFHPQTIRQCFAIGKLYEWARPRRLGRVGNKEQVENASNSDATKLINDGEELNKESANADLGAHQLFDGMSETQECSDSVATQVLDEMQIQKPEIVPGVIVQVMTKEQSQELYSSLGIWQTELENSPMETKDMEETQLPDTSLKVIPVETIVSDVVACEKMGELINESFDCIEILWDEFKVHSFEFLADPSACNVFDKMPVRCFNDRDSSIQLGNCVFDPGIVEGLSYRYNGSSKQVGMPTTEFITGTSSVQLNHVHILKENWIFDPGDFIDPRLAGRVGLEHLKFSMIEDVVVEQKFSYSGRVKADRVFMPYDRGKEHLPMIIFLGSDIGSSVDLLDVLGDFMGSIDATTSFVFDPGGALIIEKLCAESPFAVFLTNCCWASDGPILVFDPGGIPVHCKFKEPRLR